MIHIVTFTPQIPLGVLEAKKGKRYSNADIAVRMGVKDRQRIYYQLNTRIEEVKVRTIGQWLDFFAAEGQPISISDLFTVTQDPES
ncbi:MAG: hypothetical protein E6Q97_16150 [Desulfurellales bacterium]|nr:MAG: hypothetical protein E6Q97_16150 [Desulfurellales bacterium]